MPRTGYGPRWIADLAAMMEENDALTKETFADKFARTLEKRAQLMKIMSMNQGVMAQNRNK